MRVLRVGVWGLGVCERGVRSPLSHSLSPPILDAGRRLETASFLLLSEVHQPPG